ncbi:DNA/RNA non-specific endonuclease [Streptomyces noursei]|uniref:WXG100-like domain-containing protein n=1 Tax=Streptomyces noursei TaxID=1971 RepID=UPI00081C8B4E|nr:RHS repeat-associated core domain-containing protein [Streptomyces noursei ATCC 11455]MCZ0994336.1 DNA/RNA non-specific endonuclease [Streptomyces noursei]
MSAADKAKEIVQDLTGMWWPEGDEDELREAARAWRAFADDVEDCTAACHKKAQDVIDNNKGAGIEAFGAFWKKYHGGGKGYLDDVATAARDMAKALDKFADQIAEAKKKIEHELEIAGAVLVAGTALAIFTGGISEVAAAGATEAIVAAASTAGVAVSATVAEIAGTVLATAAIGSIGSITVDVVVAQGGRNLLGDQHGINVAEIKDAGVSGMLMGGAAGGAARGVKAVVDAGGVKNLLGNMKLDGLGHLNVSLPNLQIQLPNLGGPRLAMAGEGPVGPTGQPLMRSVERGGGGGGRAPQKPIPPYCKPLDSMGRATGVETKITQDMLDTGTKASRRVKPPGWEGEAADHTRGHLLARSLGGDGRSEANIAIMYDKANNEAMKDIELQIYDTVKNKGPVDYFATPVYAHPGDLIPAGIHIEATGSGLNINQTIINK